MLREKRITYLHDKKDVKNKSVYYFIDAYLNQKESNSENTSSTYEVAIRHFFETMVGKGIEDLTAEDLDFSVIDIEQYQNELSKTLKGSSINLKMSAIKKCFEKLYSYGFKNIDLSSFNIERKKEHDSRAHDHIYMAELLEAIEIIKHTQKGNIKALMLEIGFVTGFRKKSVMELTWEDISHNDKLGYNVIRTLGKGKKWDYKKISDDLNTRLRALRPDDASGKDRIFTLSDKTIQRMFDHLNSNMDFGDRKISFHSLKKGSIEEVGIQTNYDLKAMQRQGNHASAVTTLNSYAKSRDLEDMPIIDLQVEDDYDIVESLSKRDLLKIFKQLDRKTKNDILKKAKELNENE